MAAIRKHPELLDLKWVQEKLQTMSMGQLAKEVGSSHSSIKYIVDWYFSEEMKASIKYQRKPHVNKKKLG